jgi:hypothetical protein
MVYVRLTYPVRVTNLVHLFRHGLLTSCFDDYRLWQWLFYVQRPVAIPCLLLPSTIFSISNTVTLSKHAQKFGILDILLLGFLHPPGCGPVPLDFLSGRHLMPSCISLNLILNKIRQTDRQGRQLCRVRSQEVMRNPSWCAKSITCVPTTVSYTQNQVPREIAKWSRQALVYRPTIETIVYIRNTAPRRRLFLYTQHTVFYHASMVFLASNTMWSC